jgi:hypothetical protein
MTPIGEAPVAARFVSKIETGVRKVEYDERLALACVLDVPLARLISPPDGEQPIRAGGIRLDGNEVANWLVWGRPS